VKEQIIQLEAYDDVVSVRDKLGWIRAPRVLLVFPHDGDLILRERLDLILIQREATRRRAQLALITHDPVVIENARDLGIATFRTVEESHRRYWQTRRAELSVSREERSKELDEDLVEAGTRLKPEDEGLPPQTRRLIALIVFGLTLVLLLSGCYIVLPGATIHLAPAANQVSVATTVTADPEATAVDTDAGIVLARIVGVEVEGSLSVDATGTTLQPSQKARGIALFTNLVPDQVSIPAGTILRTSAGAPILFTTLVDATLAGEVGAIVEVPVEAQEAGFTGNLPSNRINAIDGPLSSRLAVTNSEPTAGGDAVDTPAISQDDMDRVRERLLQQLQQRAYAEMQTRLLESNEFIPLETLEVVLIQSETYTGYAGEVRDDVGLAMRATVQGVAVDERYARQVVYARLAEKIGDGFQLSTGSLVYRRGEVVQIDDARRVTFVMQGAGDVSAAIDPAAVRNLVRGTAVRRATEQLSRELPLASDPVIEMWPSFWPIMPVLPLRITVDISGQI
jgi:hypothetical protein